MNSIRDRKPINVKKSFHSKFEDYKSNSKRSIADSPFNDFRELYLLSAVVGLKLDLYEEIKGPKVKIFDSNVFSEHKDLPILYSIAFNKEKNAELLADDEYVLKIVEGYANGGLQIVIDAIENGNNNNLLNLAIFTSDNIEKD